MRALTELPIDLDHKRISEFCRARGILRLRLFGSVLRDDFNPDRSDVDVLADFDQEALKGVGFRYFSYGDQLSEILGRKVDFCSKLSPYLEQRVRNEALTIYEQP